MAIKMSKARVPKEPGGKGVHHLEVTPTHNGGHVVRHVMHGAEFGEAQEHAFGPEQGHEVLAHIAKHAKIEVGSGEHEESPHGGAAENESEGHSGDSDYE
jgi:hypothetical protein